jgi:hypothetical protein
VIDSPSSLQLYQGVRMPLTVRNGWCGGMRSSRSTNANMLARGFRRPRIIATSTGQDAFTVPG